MVAAFLLPILATTALYLPSGLLMPARLVVVLLAGIAAVQFLFHRGPLPRGVGVAVGAVCVVLITSRGRRRSRWRRCSSYCSGWPPP